MKKLDGGKIESNSTQSSLFLFPLDSSLEQAIEIFGNVSTPFGTTVCLKKNIPDIFSCNSRKHSRIFIMFGIRVTRPVSDSA